jgi:hypothetical protein
MCDMLIALVSDAGKLEATFPVQQVACMKGGNVVRLAIISG